MDDLQCIMRFAELRDVFIEIDEARRWSAAWKAAAKNHRRGRYICCDMAKNWAVQGLEMEHERDEARAVARRLYRENQELKQITHEASDIVKNLYNKNIKLKKENQELKDRVAEKADLLLKMYDENHELKETILEINEDNGACADEVVRLDRENQELKQQLADIQEEFARYACRVEGIATGESAEQFIKRFIDWSEDFLQAEDFDLMDLVDKLTDFQEAGEIVLGLREEPPPKERPKDVVVGTSYHSVVNSQPNTWQSTIKDDGPDIAELSAGDIL